MDRMTKRLVKLNINNMKDLPKSLSTSDWEYPYKAADKALKRIAEEADSDLLDEVVEEEDPTKKRERETKCIMVRKVVDKCLDNYRQGEYSFKESISMLADALEEL